MGDDGTAKRIEALVKGRNRALNEARDANDKADYYAGKVNPADFDREGRDGNRAVADSASARARSNEAELASLGVTDIKAETKDIIDRTGRHRNS